MTIMDMIKRNPFEKLEKDDLTVEKITLTRDEKLKSMELEKSSARKSELFNKGFGVSEAIRKQLARELKQVDRKIKLSNIELNKISEEIQLVDNLIFMHDSIETANRKDLSSKWQKISKSKLGDLLKKVNVKNAISRRNTKELLEIMEAEFGLISATEDDEETKELMDIWEVGDATQADELYQKWDKEQATKEDNLESE